MMAGEQVVDEMKHNQKDPMKYGGKCERKRWWLIAQQKCFAAFNEQLRTDSVEFAQIVQFSRNFFVRETLWKSSGVNLWTSIIWFY